MKGSGNLGAAVLAALVLACAPAAAQEAAPHAIDIPAWFAESLLDFRDEVRDAARKRKRLMVYFGQDGCPYCQELMQTNFSQKRIVDKTRRHFVAVALNLWGDRETTWIDGASLSEKELGRRLKVQFTPTLLFLDEKGEVALRLNGYQPPHKFEAALDYVSSRLESKQDFGAYVARAVKESASPALHAEPFFLDPPFDLRRGDKPLAVLFETRYCAACDELHRDGLRRPEVQALLPRFRVARFALGERSALIAPDGQRTSAAQWARRLGIAYTPSIVFFDSGGREVFRVEGYLRPFHLASSLDYVASGAYREEPSFQRFIQKRAQRLRDEGKRVDLWR